MKTSYEYLRDLCSIKNTFTARTPQVNPITERVTYIIDALRAMGIEPIVDLYDANYGTLEADKPKLVNVYAYFDFKKENTIGYLAHHDVANINSENCQDNTASIANLLGLCEKLATATDGQRNVVVGFVDAEEIVSPPRAGSRKLGDRANEKMFGNVDYFVNLELTANGKNVWYSKYRNVTSTLEGYLREKIEGISMVMTPYNDAFVLAMYGHDSLCIGTLDDENLKQAQVGFCNTWALCHRLDDTFDKANEEDMTAFVNILESLI